VENLRANSARMLYSWAQNGPLSALGCKLLAQIGRYPVGIQAIGEGSQSEFPLLEEGLFSVSTPQWIGTEQNVASGIFPPVGAHLYENCLVSPYTPGVLSSRNLLLPRSLIASRSRVTTDSGGLFYYDGSVSISKLPKSRSIPEGIHVGGAGSFNWFHFIIECLPKCLLAQRLPAEFSHFPLLLPEECRKIPAFSDALACVLGGRNVLYLKREEYFLVRRLLVIDEISISPFNLRDGNWPKIQDYSHNNDFILEFLSFFRSKLISRQPSLKVGRRVFLVRPEKFRRDYNQSELVEVARDFGFEPVAPESLTLREQADLFSNVEFAVGPSGAAWVGMIYRNGKNAPLRGLSWLPKEYEYFCSYSSLAHILDHQLMFITACTDHPLTSTRDAYISDYKVSKVDFSCALQELVGE